MIKRLKLQGYKCIELFEHTIPPFCVAVGPNDSGKSSLLEAMHSLGRTTVRPLDEQFKGPWSVEHLAWRDASEPRIRWEVELEDPDLPGLATYALEVAHGRDGRDIVLIEERLEVDGVTIFEVTTDETVQLPNGGKVPLRGANLTTGLYRLRSHPDHPDVGIVARALSATMKYGLQPDELAKASAFEPDEEEPHLDHHGYGLPSVLAAIKLADYPVFEKIESALREAVPGIDSVVIRPASVQVRLPSGDFQKMQGHRLAFLQTKTRWEVAAPLASAGVLLFLGYLTLALSPSHPRLILIEEPETGVHPHRLRMLVDLFRELSRGIGDALPTQIMLTTHSPYLLDFVEPEEVFIFTRQDNGASIATLMSEAPHLAERLSEQQLGEMWFNVREENLVRDTNT